MEYWKYKEITENYYRRNIQQLHNKKKKPQTYRNLITLLNPLNYLSNSLPAVMTQLNRSEFQFN
jgi:hypothetical protein